jgi:MFS family permease
LPVEAGVRRRLFAVLFVGSGINRTAVIASATVTALVAEDLLGSARWSGLPGALLTIGVAAGTAPLAAYMARSGRRPGMVLGLATAAAGGVLAVAAVAARSFLLLLVAMFVLGAGNSADRLSRYAAADLTTEARSGSAIAAIVWAATIGAVVGPSLLRPSEALAEAIGLPGLSGPYLVTAAFLAVSTLLIHTMLRPDPLEFARAGRPEADEPVTTSQLRETFARPHIRYAALSLIVGQFVMVIIMAMTPVHIRMAGEGLGLVGLVISAHTLGMFALSPVAGWLSDRMGRVPTIVIGQVILVISAVMAMPAQGDDRGLLISSLFLLGLGWNLSFVAGSALVGQGLTGGLRLRVQGVADSLVWGTSAVAAISAGLILDFGGYARLAMVGGIVALLALASRLRYRDVEYATAS